MSKVLVAGAGGFIGGHLAKRLIELGYTVRCVDIKPLNEWYQLHDKSENISADLMDKDNCYFATKDINQIYNLACFDKETEVWTQRGWKLFKDLEHNEKVATLNKEGFLEWQQPINYINYHYNGEMYCFNSQTTDIKVTPNHRMYVRKPHWDHFEFVEAQNCNLHLLRMKRGLKWIGNKISHYEVPIPQNCHYNTKINNKYEIKSFLRFLGYYLSEGSTCYQPKKGNYRIHISNTDMDIINDISKCVKEMGFTPYFDRTTSHGISFHSKIMMSYCQQFGLASDKFIPEEIKNLEPELLREIFDTLMLGDGSKNNNVYYTTSKRLADDFAELCLKLGYSYTISFQKSRNHNRLNQYIVYFCSKDETVLAKRPTKIEYNDVVYCVEVPNQIIYVRRNGKPTWVGNCRMGGIQYIYENKSECMTSVLINTNLLMAAKDHKIDKYFYSSSACIYNIDLQNINEIINLKESDAYPAKPEPGYGEEKLFGERMCQIYMEDYGIKTYSARFFNIFGPFGTWDGGKEKAPAAICRKVATAKLSGNHTIEIGGDGTQIRNFTYVDDCVDGILNLVGSNHHEPINLGSSECVTINELVSIVEDIANVKLERKYLLNFPKGVHSRNTDNTTIKQALSWEPSTPLRVGLEKTYAWIESEIKNGKNGQ